MTDDVQNGSMATIGVIGAGTMGSGIAEVFAQSGYDVVIVETSDEFLDRGLQRITADLDKLVSRERLTDEKRDTILSRIEGTTEFDRLGNCDFVIEAVPEEKELKAELFRKLSETVDPETILASNTSSLSITELGHCATNPARVIGMHFFNPVPKMELVEVVPGRATSDDTVAFTVAMAMQLGKNPIVVSDSPGFVVNRLMIPMINEAVFALNEGVASAEDIDAVMRLGASHPMGPLELADMIGLDTVLSIMEAMHHAFGDDKYRPAPLLRQMVSGGQLGRKSGQGFYSYEKGN
ncbi:MAG TPA: 3-hydroxybutyryl-CoA dehydrogenase [Thermomicrobiales bacterium]|nr:3-hydroxybutyryl-CoA dehydrogenase [Thermomicrobiales bacterium]